uniref:Uncharacterized protein n=1 Tax=Electrophorus electricus TaxID=8005 RepID=A0AAY5EA71_ELEEL
MMSHLHWFPCSFADSSLNMLVKMENNMLFFCKVGMERLVRMHPWTEPGVPAALYLNPEEQFIMISLEEGRVQAQSYPVRSESRSTTRGDPDSCPFITFTHSMSKLTYYIDKGNCLELWADVVYPENKGVNVQLLSNRKQLLMIKERTYFESVYAMLSFVSRYDGDKFVQNVDANFIVWDKFGRKDYSFNATMHQVACLCEAQTWKKMLAGGSPLEKAWGPENYRSCFVLGSGKLGNLNQPYEVMNRSSMNYLTFPSVENTTYVFNVKILDPNYSFCDLQAVFAVQTYGEKIW